MNCLNIIFLLVIVCAVDKSLTKKNYKDHKVVLIKIRNEVQLDAVKSLELNAGFVFMDPPVQVNTEIELVISHAQFVTFEEIANENTIEYETKTNNLQSWIDNEQQQKVSKDGELSFDRYNSVVDIYEFLDNMKAKFKDNVTIFSIGQSFEGREIKGIKISHQVGNPAIFIEANIHAREWISSATAVWLVNELLTSEENDIQDLTNEIDWYIIPVTNPDGYEYTRTEDRLWRKTRSKHSLFCIGVDPNRNFGFNWGKGGSSKLACTDTYMGPDAFSEKETFALNNFYQTIAHKVEAYISFHSAAQLLLYPYGDTASTENVSNAQDLYNIANHTVMALEERSSTVYKFGNVVSMLYVASGSSMDHAYGHYKTPIAYTYELRTSKGDSRFILPSIEIIPNSMEVLDSLVALVEKSRELGYLKSKDKL